MVTLSHPSRSSMITVALCVGLVLTSACSAAKPIARTITVQFTDGGMQTVHTDRQTVGEALRDAGIVLYVEDEVTPDLTAPVSDDMLVVIQSSVPVTITNFWGETHELRTRMQTVRALMADIGYVPAENEIIRPDVDTAITADLHIDLIRQNVENTEIESEIPFDTIYTRDNTKDYTYRAVQTTGARGIRKKVVRAIYENDVFIGRETLSDDIVQEPVDEVVVVGTQTPPNGTPLGATIASYYGSAFHGRRTASGETFDKNAFTAAHRTLPFGSQVKVTNAANSQSVVVRITDRGPYAHNRGIDLSEAAFGQISGLGAGVIHVDLEVVTQ